MTLGHDDSTINIVMAIIMVNVDLYSAIIAKVSNALDTLVSD